MWPSNSWSWVRRQSRKPSVAFRGGAEGFGMVFERVPDRKLGIRHV